MAAGDVISGISSVAAGAYLDLQPGASVEWSVHNIYHEDAVTIELYDGTNSLVWGEFYGAGNREGIWNANNTRRLRVKNAHASAAKLIGYDGREI
jgi:hypothetical protein